MKRFGVAALILLAAGCATAEKKEVISAPPETITRQVDYLAVQHDLGMDVAPDWVGYREKRFDACRMAPDLPDVKDCSHAYFVEVGIQLSCRPTEEAEGTLLEQGDLTPIANRQLRWVLGKASGQIRTDSAGFGVVLAITSSSMKAQGLRVSTGEDFLLMRAGQANHVVTPVSWCK